MAANKLTRQQSQLFEFLSTCSQGDVVSTNALLTKTTWKPATLGTYDRKNNLAPFLLKRPDGSYLVLKDGFSISKADIAEAFTQVREQRLTLYGGTPIRLGGASYVLERKIGEGAVAHVWKAHNQTDSKAYAIKIMNPRTDLLQPTLLENVKQRFRREARNGLILDSEYVIKYRGFGEHEGHPVIVMDLADSNLMDALNNQQFSLKESIEILVPCARGLAYLHDRGLFHRDVKPHNILKIGERYVLGDLGIVKWSEFNPAFTSAATLTHDSVQLGSWYYMAPEQRKSASSADTKSDIYALGVTWYQMLTRTTLDPAEVAAKEYSDPTNDLTANAMLRAMLSFTPKDRPSAKDTLEWLANW